MPPLSCDAAAARHQVDHRVRRVAASARACARPSSPSTLRANSITAHCMPEADAEERHAALARAADRLRSCPRCRARRSRRARGCRRRPRAALDALARARPRRAPCGRSTLHVVRDAGVRQRLVDRLVGVVQLDVLADDRDLDRRRAASGCRRPSRCQSSTGRCSRRRQAAGAAR